MPALKNKKKAAPKRDDDDFDFDDEDDGSKEEAEAARREKAEAKKKAKQEKKDKKKAEKAQKRSDTDGKKGGGLKFFLFFLIVFLVFGGFIFGVFNYNIFNLRDKYIRPVLEKVPIVNNLLPPASEEIPLPSIEELQIQIASLEKQISDLTDENTGLKSANSNMLDEINRLREYEEAQTQFRDDKLEFDRMIGENDPNAYENFYSQISPENAEIIYREVIGVIADDKELSSYVSTYQNMDESAAAKIFEQMIGTDLDLVVSILRNIKSEQRAMIMAAMSAPNAAVVTKRMSPGQ